MERRACISLRLANCSTENESAALTVKQQPVTGGARAVTACLQSLGCYHAMGTASRQPERTGVPTAELKYVGRSSRSLLINVCWYPGTSYEVCL